MNPRVGLIFTTMNATVESTLRAVLMEENQLCLPGLGTLRLHVQPATVGGYRGQAAPPAERVGFLPNLTLDDGRLLQALIEKQGLERVDAQLMLDGYLRSLREQLDAGRSVAIPEVGRFFKKHDGTLTFTPGEQNFSKATFGLPTVLATPIKRMERQRSAAADPLSVTAGAGATTGGTVAAKASLTQRVRERLAGESRPQQWLWAVVTALALVLLIVLLFLLVQSITSAAADDPLRPVADNDEVYVPAPRPSRPGEEAVPASRLDPDAPPRLGDRRTPPSGDNALTTPAQPPAGGSTIVPAPATAPPSAGPTGTNSTIAPTAPTREPIATDTPTSPTGRNEALIAIGLFGSPANVRKNVSRLEAAGYEAFSLAEGRNTRVGARVLFRNDRELNDAVAELRERFEVKAFVYRLNGELQAPE